MAINENVYGPSNTWVDSWFLSSGNMKAKCPNFNNGSSLDSSTLSAGNTAQKIHHNELIDRTISLTALGTESLYSHLIYVHGFDETFVDNVPVTEFFFCESRIMTNRRNIEENRSFISTDYPYNMWKEYATDPDNYYHNYSDLTIPYTELNPRKVLYVLQVYPCKADGTEYGSWVFFGTYDRNSSNIKTNFPYIMGVRLNPRIDNTTTSTPNRVALSDPDAFFGIALNREFSAIQNNDIKINYAIFRGMMMNNNIVIYGTDGKQPYDADYYNIFIAKENDIRFDTETGRVYAIMEYDREFILQQAACFGVYFRISDQGNSAGSITTLPLDSEAICLGILDDYGIGHGQYTRGSANRDNPIWNWDSYRESPYDYTVTPDPNQYEHETHLAELPTVTAWNNMYLDTTGLHFKGVLQALESETDLPNWWLNGQEPLENVVALKRIFLSPSLVFNGMPRNSVDLVIGAWNSHVLTTQFLAGYEFRRIELGSKHIFPKHGNFLDYEPYTTISIYVPYCGSMRLDTSIFMDHDCKITMNVNARTGEVMAIIYVDNIEYASMQGNASVDLPVQGLAASNYNMQKSQLQTAVASKVFDLATQTLGYATGATISTALGNPTGATLQGLMGISNAGSSLMDIAMTSLQLAHLAPTILCLQRGTTSLAVMDCVTPFIFIERPVYLENYNEENFAKTRGFACYEVISTRDCAGYTEGINPLLDEISCTMTEKKMIENALREGCIF